MLVTYNQLAVHEQQLEACQQECQNLILSSVKPVGLLVNLPWQADAQAKAVQIQPGRGTPAAASKSREHALSGAGSSSGCNACPADWALGSAPLCVRVGWERGEKLRRCPMLCRAASAILLVSLPAAKTLPPSDGL